MLKLRNSGRMVDPVKTNYSVLPLFSSMGVAIYHIDIFWTPNIYFNEDRMNFKKSTRLEVIL